MPHVSGHGGPDRCMGGSLANLGMVTSMGAQAGAGNLVEARRFQADAWAGYQADMARGCLMRPGFIREEQNG